MQPETGVMERRTPDGPARGIHDQRVRRGRPGRRPNCRADSDEGAGSGSERGGSDSPHAGSSSAAGSGATCTSATGRWRIGRATDRARGSISIS